MIASFKEPWYKLVSQETSFVVIEYSVEKCRGDSMQNSICFILNGREMNIPDPGNRTLLQYLRNVECLKGTKEACGTGHCGACSVLIDDQLARACVTPMKALAGRRVETIENVARDVAEFCGRDLEEGAVEPMDSYPRIRDMELMAAQIMERPR